MTINCELYDTTFIIFFIQNKQVNNNVEVLRLTFSNSQRSSRQQHQLIRKTVFYNKSLQCLPVFSLK